MILGVLFATRKIQMYAILATLIILLLMARNFDGCFLTQFEGTGSFPSLSEIGRRFCLKDVSAVSIQRFEEILIANLIIIIWIRIFAVSALPVGYIFQS